MRMTVAKVMTVDRRLTRLSALTILLVMTTAATRPVHAAAGAVPVPPASRPQAQQAQPPQTPQAPVASPPSTTRAAPLVLPGTTSAPQGQPPSPPGYRDPSAPPPPTPWPVAPVAPLRPPAATDAATALEHTRAAYEYGDIDEMVESARQLTEGRLQPTQPQRATALRYLGIGLYLTNRHEGAETAFFELLRLRPESRLDPQTTRPDVVAFFEQVRTRYAQPIREAARASNRKVFAWNFFPPAGQFQNGHRGRAYTIAGLEVLSLASTLTTLALLNHWEKPGHTFDDPDQARAFKMVNYLSVAVFVGTVAFGIIDGMAHYPDDPEDAPPPPAAATRLSIGLGGVALEF